MAVKKKKSTKKAVAKKSKATKKKVVAKKKKTATKKATKKAAKKAAKKKVTKKKAAKKVAKKATKKKTTKKKATKKKAATQKATKKKVAKKPVAKKATKKATKKTTAKTATKKTTAKKAAPAKSTEKTTAKKVAPVKATKKVATKKATKKTVVNNAVAEAPEVFSSQVLVGQKVPNFMLPATGDKQVSLDSLKGKKVVLYFYPKDATPGCTIEGHDFTRMHNDFQSNNTEVFGISRDSMKSHENFKAKQNYSIDLISDENEELCKIFGVIKMKNMYGRQVRGIERSTFLINENGELVSEWRGVQVPGHAEEVLAAAKK